VLLASAQIGVVAWIKIGAIFLALLWVAYTGIKPRPGDSRKWYDRTIRTVGGLFVLTFMILAVIIVLKDR
jgi:hypothetical protein